MSEDCWYYFLVNLMLFDVIWDCLKIRLIKKVTEDNNGEF